MKHEVMTSSKR